MTTNTTRRRNLDLQQIRIWLRAFPYQRAQRSSLSLPYYHDAIAAVLGVVFDGVLPRTVVVVVVVVVVVIIVVVVGVGVGVVVVWCW